jgi:membrane protease YdiL (CAAX protease family)
MNALLSAPVVTQVTPAPRLSHWRLALVFGGALGIGTMLVLPYVTATTGHPLAGSGLPVGALIAISGVQGAIVGFLLSWAGLAMGQSIGLDAPLVRAWIARTPFRGPAHWGKAALVGVLVTAVVFVIDKVFFAQLLAAVPETAGHAARWKGALASFYGGVGEELQVRLFLMTALAWGLAKVSRSTAPWIFVVALTLAALAFGAGHLPLAAQVFGSLSTVVVVHTVLLNAVAGVAFGVLYWRWGLEHAMVAHFCADIVIHVILAS